MKTSALDESSGEERSFASDRQAHKSAALRHLYGNGAFIVSRLRCDKL